MTDFDILTDSASDLPEELHGELNIQVLPLTVRFRGQEFEDYNNDQLKTFFDALRAGEEASTAAVNPQRWAAAMEPSLAAGRDLLVIAFSSGLSTTYQAAELAKNELAEKYPDRKIRVVDSLCASLGEGLLVWYACKKRDEGLSLDELADWVEREKFHLCHWFTVDDLMYLKRGGRVSAATALLGTMLQIKPVLHVDNEGHLINMSKARGRKASIQALAAKAKELALPGENETVFICHGDCREDAEYLASLAREQLGAKNVVIGYVGAVIGSHSGPGTLALFFLGKNR